MHIPTSIASALVTLLVTIGPIETGIVFTSLTAGVHRPQRRGLAMRSVAIAGFVLLAFAMGGGLVLSLLHVSLPAFRVAAGVLLMLQAVQLVFSHPGFSSINEAERQEAREPGDIAVFPLAFPIIAGPGSLCAVVLLMSRSESWIESGTVLAMLGFCLLLTLAAMLAAERLVNPLGKTGADVIGRISGMLLAALAFQFIFDGLSAAPMFAR